MIDITDTPETVPAPLKTVLFRGYVNSPTVAYYPEGDDTRKVTPSIVATLKKPIDDTRVGLFINTIDGRRFRIEHVSHVYETKMVGEKDKNGDYRIVSTEEVTTRQTDSGTMAQSILTQEMKSK